LYIAVGVATSASVLVATAFSLIVLVPVLSRVTAGIDDSLDDRVLSAVNFSKFATNKTYVSAFHTIDSFSFVFQLLYTEYPTFRHVSYKLAPADVQQFS